MDNRSKQTVDATLAFSILNAVGYDGQALLTTNRFEGFGENITRFRTDAGFAGLEMTSRKYPSDHLRADSMALVTTHPTVSAKMAWDSAYPPEQRNDRGPRWDSMRLWFEELRDPGTLDGAGCCPMNCTHVWNCEQALAHLFPDLERSMRVTDFEVNVNEDGAMAFRTLVPTGDRKGLKFFGQPSQMYPAADGQMGCILKLYREWQLSGDLEFLRRLWPSAKRALEFAWNEWDVDRDGPIEGRQHNTYDIEFFGPNPMIGTLYLGALLAGERMARALGEETAAVEYRRVFEAGRANLDRELWRGGFYIQHVPEAQASTKYQFGEGCLSDQMLGQWFAHVVGLGYLLPPDHVKETVRSIYSHNFKHSFADFPNLHRVYALNDEKGVVLCSVYVDGRPVSAGGPLDSSASVAREARRM